MDGCVSQPVLDEYVVLCYVMLWKSQLQATIPRQLTLLLVCNSGRKTENSTLE